jgi:hypothetical protein
MGLFKRSTSNQGDQLMSETLTKIIVNCETGVVAEVPLTGEEIAQREVDAAQAETERVAKEEADAAAAVAKTALLARLGMTADEAKLLLA